MPQVCNVNWIRYQVDWIRSQSAKRLHSHTHTYITVTKKKQKQINIGKIGKGAAAGGSRNFVATVSILINNVSFLKRSKVEHRLNLWYTMSRTAIGKTLKLSPIDSHNLNYWKLYNTQNSMFIHFFFSVQIKISSKFVVDSDRFDIHNIHRKNQHIQNAIPWYRWKRPIFNLIITIKKNHRSWF